MTNHCRFSLLTTFAITCGTVAVAQEQIATVPQPMVPVHSSASTSCNPWKFQALPGQLSFGQYTCYQLSQVASPAALLSGAAMAGFSQLRNSPHMNSTDSDDFGQRLGHIYARRASRATAELLVGYLHHEDPRPHVSGEQGAWRRTRAAFLNVLTSPDQDGNSRMAFAPIAGSLGSGFSSMALYQHQAGYTNALQRSGIVYSHYFIRSLVREFSPELWSLAPRFIRKYR